MTIGYVATLTVLSSGPALICLCTLSDDQVTIIHRIERTSNPPRNIFNVIDGQIWVKHCFTQVVSGFIARLSCIAHHYLVQNDSQ